MVECNSNMIVFCSCRTVSVQPLWAVFLLLSAANLATRFYAVGEPAWVCWDETHFGKMGSW